MRERIRLRRDSAFNWSTNNPVLASGEPGVELDTNRFKVGNGTSHWNTLPYMAGGSSNLSQLILGDGQNDSLYWNTSNRLNIVGSGGTSIVFNDSTDTITISVTGIQGGNNTSISNYGDNRILTSDGTPSGIYAESGLQFDGNNLIINSGLSASTGNFSLGLYVDNTAVSISGHAHSTTDVSKYNSSIADNVVSTPVGGAVAAAASVWKTRSLNEILDTILFPTVDAYVSVNVDGSLTFSGNSSSIQEVGTVVNRTLTASLNRGTIVNGNGASGPAVVGAVNTYTFAGTSIASPVTQSDSSYSFSHITTNGSNSWSVSIAYASGTGDYFNNKGSIGTNLNGLRAASAITRNSSIINGIYPYFYGISNTNLSSSQIASLISANSGTKVLSSSNGTVTVPFDGSNKFFWFAHIAADTTKTKWYRNEINKGDIADSTTLFNAPSTVNINSPNSLWSNISYKTYITTYATILDATEPVQFRNS